MATHVEIKAQLKWPLKVECLYRNNFKGFREGNRKNSHNLGINWFGHCSVFRSVRAFVVVQESPQILTHSTRRFLVVCHFQPATITVESGWVAGLKLALWRFKSCFVATKVGAINSSAGRYWHIKTGWDSCESFYSMFKACTVKEGRRGNLQHVSPMLLFQLSFRVPPNNKLQHPIKKAIINACKGCTHNSNQTSCGISLKNATCPTMNGFCWILKEDKREWICS